MRVVDDGSWCWPQDASFGADCTGVCHSGRGAAASDSLAPPAVQAPKFPAPTGPPNSTLSSTLFSSMPQRMPPAPREAPVVPFNLVDHKGRTVVCLADLITDPPEDETSSEQASPRSAVSEPPATVGGRVPWSPPTPRRSPRTAATASLPQIAVYGGPRGTEAPCDSGDQGAPGLDLRSVPQAPADCGWVVPSLDGAVGQKAESESTTALPSMGSALHAGGTCKPCAFFHSKGCKGGPRCMFCHLCGPEARRQRRREKIESRQAARQARRAALVCKQQVPPARG